MNKNIKSIFLVLAFITLLATLGAVCAADDANNAIATDNSISDATVTNTDSNPVVQEPIQTASNDNNVDTKTIEKENKNLKTSTKTVEVNNIDELTNTINNAVNDTDNDEYIINLNEGSYEITKNVNLNTGYKTPNIIINANNQTLSTTSDSLYLSFNNGCNISINNATIGIQIQNYKNNITINNCLQTNSIINRVGQSIWLSNSFINSSMSNEGTLYIDNYTDFADNIIIEGNGQIIADNISKVLPYMEIYNGNYTVENMTLNGRKTNNGILNIKNSNITGYLINQGELNAEKSNLYNIASNTANSTTYINNSNITYQININGNCTIENSYINKFGANSYSNMTIRNSTLNNNNNNVEPYSTLIIEDDCIFGDNFYLSVYRNSRIIYNDYAKLAPYLSAYSNDSYILENITISSSKINYANLTIRNATINTTLTNNGNLTITDDVIFGDNFQLTDNGEIIINNTNRITPYLRSYNGNYIIENANIITGKTNDGNLTIKNSTINSSITNNGNLTICDDVIFGENALITGNGQIITNDTSKITPYINTYNGNYTLENMNIKTSKNNYNNLTIKNCEVNAIITTNGTLIIKNSTLNNIITNNGTLIIDDDCILGDNFQIWVQYNSNIISNRTNITSYITQYRDNNCNFTVENQIINKALTVNGFLTVINSTINGQLSCNGNISFYNSTLNSSTNIYRGYSNNWGNIILDDNTILGEKFSKSGTGQLIGNITNERVPYLSRFDNGTVSNLTLNKVITGKNLTIINSTNTRSTTLINSNIINSTFTLLTVTNSTLNYSNITGNYFYNYNETVVSDSILNSPLYNYGTLIIDDNTVFGENFNIAILGEIIINDTSRINPYISDYYNNTTIENNILNGNKINHDNLTLINTIVNNQITNDGILTLNNSIIKGNIINNGYLIVDEETIFEDNAKITGNGYIITDNITRLLPYLSTINGNYTIKDTTLDKIYNFIGDIKLDNCTITAGFDNNYGLLNITNSVINVSDNYDYWIENSGVIIIDDNTQIVNGEINDLGTVYYGNVPDDYIYDSRVHIVNNKTLDVYFKNGLTVLVNPGDTLDFQGTINRPFEIKAITINKPVNIITSTNDGKLDNLTEVTYGAGSSGSNITGLYTFNTQTYIGGSNSVFDNISNVVDNKIVGTNKCTWSK